MVLLEFLNMGSGEIMVILAVILLLFGGKKLPELAKGLGKGIREFKDASEGVKREIHKNINLAGLDEELNTPSFRNGATSIKTDNSAAETPSQEHQTSATELNPVQNELKENKLV